MIYVVCIAISSSVMNPPREGKWMIWFLESIWKLDFNGLLCLNFISRRHKIPKVDCTSLKFNLFLHQLFHSASSVFFPSFFISSLIFPFFDGFSVATGGVANRWFSGDLANLRFKHHQFRAKTEPNWLQKASLIRIAWVAPCLP